MAKVIINELGIAEALNSYLETKGYQVKNLELRYEHKSREFSALVDPETTEQPSEAEAVNDEL